MDPKLVPFLTLIVGGVVYQLALKRVPADASPFAVLAAAYAVAGLVCLGLMLVIGPRPSWDQFTGRGGLTVLGIAAGVLLIEGSFLFGYRLGLKVGTLSLTGLAVTSGVLLAVGWLAFGEKLSAREWAGVLLCLAGAALVKSGEGGPVAND